MKEKCSVCKNLTMSSVGLKEVLLTLAPVFTEGMLLTPCLLPSEHVSFSLV